jgi:hypothetical protein
MEKKWRGMYGFSLKVPVCTKKKGCNAHFFFKSITSFWVSNGEEGQKVV